MAKKSVTEILKKNPQGISLKEISKLSGLSEEQVKKELDELDKGGKLNVKDGEKKPKIKTGISNKETLKENFKVPKKIISRSKIDKEIGKSPVKEKPKEKTKNKTVKNNPALTKRLLELKKEAATLKKKKKVSKKKVKKDTKKIVKKKTHKNKLNKKIVGEKTENSKIKKLTEKSPLKEKPLEKHSKKDTNPEEFGEVKKTVKKPKIDVAAIAQEIKEEQIKQQRSPLENLPEGKKKSSKDFVVTGVPGFDELLSIGIPKGNAMIVAGGAGSGKTIFCMQTMVHQSNKGKKCLMMTLEENEEKLIGHMEDFGWPAKDLIKKGNLKIQRINPFDITRNVEALLAKQKGELLIDVDPVILPKDFSKPDFIVIDSLTAIASAFTGKDESYRIYIEQLFRFLEQIGATSFLITETEQVPKIFSPTGVEEFLADGVVVLYSLKHGNVRENAIEILKLRGASHQKKIVAMQIGSNGVTVYPEQEVFSDI